MGTRHVMYDLCLLTRLSHLKAFCKRRCVNDCSGDRLGVVEQNNTRWSSMWFGFTQPARLSRLSSSLIGDETESGHSLPERQSFSDRTLPLGRDLGKRPVFQTKKSGACGFEVVQFNGCGRVTFASQPTTRLKGARD